MEVINFIKKHGFEKLTSELGIKVKHYPEFDLYLLNYDQIESPKMHPIVRECRSLILSGDLTVVSKAFDRFFNYGEADTLNFNFDEAVIFEQVDGSLIKIYWCPATRKWEISTRGSAFGEVEHQLGLTFRERVLRVLGQTEDDFQKLMDLNCWRSRTYVFEYIGPDNRHVTPYKKSEMVLIGVFSLCDGDQTNPSVLEETVEVLSVDFFGIRAPKIYYSSGVQDIIQAAKKLDGLEKGFVVMNLRTKERVKIKSPQFVAVHHLRDNGALNPNKICELVILGEEEEYLTYFNEDREFFQPYIDARKKLILSLERSWVANRTIVDQKEFALKVKDLPYARVLFDARKKSIGIHQAFLELDLSFKVKLLRGLVNDYTS